MENQCNCTVCQGLIKALIEKIEKWEQSKDNSPSKKINEFDINNLDNAAIVLSCSKHSVREAISNNTLKKDIHYRHNGKRKYLFSKKELIKLKGTI